MRLIAIEEFTGQVYQRDEAEVHDQVIGDRRHRPGHGAQDGGSVIRQCGLQGIVQRPDPAPEFHGLIG